MRAPSYLYSSAEVPPCAASTSSKSPAICASIGESGTPGRTSAGSSVAEPPRPARRATSHRAAASRLRRHLEGACDRLEHEPVRGAHAQLAADDLPQGLSLLGRGPRRERPPQVIAAAPRAGTTGGGG